MYKFLALLLAGLAQFACAQDRVVIISIGTQSKWCEASCQDMETALVEHCERGCRFFDLAQQSDILRFNDSVSLVACTESCNEAYKHQPNRNACINGCNQFPKQHENVAQAAQAMQEETKRQMNFISSIMDMMTSAIWNQPADTDASYEFEDDSGYPVRPKGGLFGDSLSKLNRLEKKNNFDDDVELIPLMSDDFSPISDDLPSICDTRQWLHTLSVILVLLGSVLLIGLSVCYIIALRFKKVKKSDSLSVLEVKPPSYDVAIRKDYFELPKCIVPIHGHSEKDCKNLI